MLIDTLSTQKKTQRETNRNWRPQLITLIVVWSHKSHGDLEYNKDDTNVVEARVESFASFDRPTAEFTIMLKW